MIDQTGVPEGYVAVRHCGEMDKCISCAFDTDIESCVKAPECDQDRRKDGADVFFIKKHKFVCAGCHAELTARTENGDTIVEPCKMCAEANWLEGYRECEAKK